MVLFVCFFPVFNFGKSINVGTFINFGTFIIFGLGTVGSDSKGQLFRSQRFTLSSDFLLYLGAEKLVF